MLPPQSIAPSRRQPALRHGTPRPPCPLPGSRSPQAGRAGQGCPSLPHLFTGGDAESRPAAVPPALLADGSRRRRAEKLRVRRSAGGEGERPTYPLQPLPVGAPVLPGDARVPRGPAGSVLRLTDGESELSRLAASEPGTGGRRSGTLRRGAGSNHSPRGGTASGRRG